VQALVLARNPVAEGCEHLQLRGELGKDPILFPEYELARDGACAADGHSRQAVALVDARDPGGGTERAAQQTKQKQQEPADRPRQIHAVPPSYAPAAALRPIGAGAVAPAHKAAQRARAALR